MTLEEMEVLDLVIIGAGIHGLSMLKTYRNVHPEASIIALEKGNSLGEVWAKDRLYPGLRTNNHCRTFEFGDYPMSTKGFDVAEDHIPGHHVNDYLLKYAVEYDLEKHIRYNCNVEAAVDNVVAGWTLTVEQVLSASGSTPRHTIEARKLVVATGLTSEPFMSSLKGRDTFDAPIYHTSELAKAENSFGPFKRVTLLSREKFSWDIACAYAIARVIPELLLQTRLITWLSLCIWDDGFSWVRSFFHQRWLGRSLVDTFFMEMQHSAEEINGYDRHPETAKFKPWDDVFFIGTNRGLLNYGLEFFDFVRQGQIRVHVADIECLSDHTVHLSNDKFINADVLICGTRWKDTPQLNFVTEKELGLPGHISSSAKLYIPHADIEIFNNCPKLQNQPKPRYYKPMTEEKDVTTPEPCRQYRFMVPPEFIESRTLASVGAYRSPATTIIAQSQALWITAFFDNQIPALCSPDDAALSRIMYKTVLHTQFDKWRYSRGFGPRFPELWFDCLPYVDLMLKDIGIENQRKQSWWAERFTPYMPADYVGIVDEYKDVKK